MKMLRNLIVLVFFTNTLAAQEENKVIEEGNGYYRRQQYDQAADAYQKALQNSPSNQTARFNLANALIRENKTEDAQKLLTGLNNDETNTNLRSKATYNEGVILSQQKKLEESIELYKESLRLNPNDQEARENLQKALLELKKKNPPKEQNEKKKKQQQKPPPRPKISPQEAQQQLKLLEQKEKQIRERLQKSSETGNSQPKDW